MLYIQIYLYVIIICVIAYNAQHNLILFITVISYNLANHSESELFTFKNVLEINNYN